MGSDSSIFMTRAVLLSLLFHLFVLFLMSFFLTLNPKDEVFPKIKIYFTTSAPEVSGSGSQIISVAEQAPAETVRKTVNQAVSALDNLIPSNIEVPLLDKMIDLPLVDISNDKQILPLPLPVDSAEQEFVSAVQESSQDMVELENIKESKTESSAVMEDQISSTDIVVLDGQAGETVETPGANSDNAAGNSDNTDLQWFGGSAVLRTVPEPNFQLPYNAILPDVIMISFKVQSDGTVVSIRIQPPGSGHMNLDQQIRTYVNSFFFDPFDASEEDKVGSLRLNLRERGGGT